MFLREACRPRQSVFNRDRRDVVLDLTELLEDKVNASDFFNENFITGGMKVLLEKSFERLENRSDQASTFLLTQAMGGGKTHSMIALGLLAQNPDLRKRVVGDEYNIGNRVDKVRVVGFNGRQTDAPLGIWGSIAEQLGKKDVFNEYYSPLAAPGPSAWINLLKGEPTLILLDELPPYFNYAKTREIGAGNLADVTTAALSNLLVAANKEELSNVCVVISDLSASYEEGSEQINRALENFKKETNRSVLPIEPVSSQGDEIYNILRTRLFEELPNKDVIKTVAGEYKDAVKKAKEMDVTNASPDAYAAQLIESYPFHFSIRNLYARFKENPGFQQTRGLIRLMRMIVSNMYDGEEASKNKLIHPYNINMNNEEIFSEVKSINPSLIEAITHDVANSGNSVAETLDREKFEDGTDVQDVSKLILVSSLANIPGADLGLRQSDIVGFLCAPGRDISRVKKQIVDYLPTQAWYLHESKDGKLFYKNQQNLAAKLHGLAKSYNRESSVKELRAYLRSMFDPSLKDLYQNIYVLPAIDEIDIVQDRTSLIVTEPSSDNTQTKLSSLWEKFANDLDYKNRVLFLSGNHATLSRIVDNAAQFKAINTIIADFESEGVSERDSQMIAAKNNLDKIQLAFRSSIQETFTMLVYPSKGGFRTADCRINFTDNYFGGENLLRETLKKVQKFTDEVDTDTFRRKCEARLFSGQTSSQWREVKRKAATNMEWQLHRPDALDQLKTRSIEQGAWLDEGGVINAKPPAPKTELRIESYSKDSESGETTLRITPINGDLVYYEIGDSEPTPASNKVDNLKAFKTNDLILRFICVDAAKKHETGPSQIWKNTLDLKYSVHENNGELMVGFVCSPHADIFYTTDGSDPKDNGVKYEGTFPAPENSRYVLAIAKRDGVESGKQQINLEQWRKKKVELDPSAPCAWTRSHTGLTAKAAYDFMARLEKFNGAAFEVEITVDSNDEQESINYTASPDYGFCGKSFSSKVKKLQGALEDGSQLILDISKIKFEKGQDLLDWVADEKTMLRPGEV